MLFFGLAALLLLGVAVLVSVPAFAQGPARPQIPPDIAGEWRLENNEADTTAQPPLGDYLGIPFNDAGRHAVGHHRGVDLGHAGVSVPAALGPAPVARPRRRAHSQGTGPAHARGQGLSHPVHAVAGPADLHGRTRPHPPAWAPHSWTGFSTGEWVGNTLKVTTTHLKDGYLKRGGPQTSDMLTMTEFITRHGDILTVVTVVDDPLYLDEPFVESVTYAYDPTASVNMETCNGSSFAENGGTDRHHVPHFLPGQNSGTREWLKTESWIPPAAAVGGVKTIYPEYRSVMNGSVNINALTVPRRGQPFRRRNESRIRVPGTARSTCCRCRATSTC